MMRDLDSLFDSIKELKDNWNGYGAKSFNPLFVEKCRGIIKELNDSPFVVPTANNSIQIEYTNNHGYLEIEIFEDSAKVFKLGSNHETFSFRLLSVDSLSLNMVIDSFFHN